MPSNHRASRAQRGFEHPFAEHEVTAQNGYGGDDPSYADINTKDPSSILDHSKSVVIRLDEYRTLLRTYDEYNALRTTLLAGGVTIENIEILINTGLQQQQVQHVAAVGNAPPSPVTPQRQPDTQSIITPTNDKVEISQDLHYLNTNGDQCGNHNGKGHHHGQGHAYGRVAGKQASKNIESPSENSDVNTNTFSVQGGGGVGGSKPRRTLLFTGIPKGTDYCDLVNVIRGGPLVDVWMKNSDHCASVSFVDPADAEAYFRYAKRNDIYIKGRRIQIKWRENARQFVIMRNIARQIQYEGASRVLRICNAPSTLTDERLRDDLDHIANLRIEKIERIGSDIHCSLNSICAALFAKTCLRSRAYYKGSKVEFGVDECAAPLPESKGYSPEGHHKSSPPPQQSQNHHHRHHQRGPNRFDALFAEDGGEELADVSDDDGESSCTFTQDDDDRTSLTDSTDVGSWADRTAAESSGGAHRGNYW